MNIVNEMQYIKSWATSLLEICDKLEKIFDSWDDSLPTDSNIKSTNVLWLKSAFDKECAVDIASTVLASNWDAAHYDHSFDDIPFNEEAYQLIEELEMYTSKLEGCLGKITADYSWKPIRDKVLIIRLLARRALKLSELPSN